MLPDSENPFAPPQTTSTVSPLGDGLTWSLGIREIVVALVVLLVLGGSVAAFYALVENSMIPAEERLLVEVEEDLDGMMVASLLTAIFVLGIVLWNEGILFSAGGLIALLLGTVIWGVATAVLFTPLGALVIWVTVLLAVILGLVLLRR
ncbi:MAG TPA: hypothetical protein PLD05_12815 [Thermogutta sp.]|nr:hypothetical protein [Thermogutta sp.]